jgi:hypothetical protein
MCRAWYASKPSGPLGAVARPRTQVTPDATTGSFGNDHLIEWPLGTGGIPTG